MLLVTTPAGAVRALALGAPLLESALGERLMVMLPVLNTAGVGWPERCGWQLVTVAPDGALDSPRLRSAGRDGRPVLLLSTLGPVKEPVLQFTVELACGTGYRLARSYALLLDPPGYGRTRRPAVTAAAAPPPRATQADARPPLARGDAVTVAPGDTLSELLGHHRPRRDGPALRQAVVAANPQAFRNGDPNMLLAGARLVLPEASAETRRQSRQEDPSAPGPALRLLGAAEEARQTGLRLSWELDEARLEAARTARTVDATRAGRASGQAQAPRDGAGATPAAQAVTRVRREALAEAKAQMAEVAAAARRDGEALAAARARMAEMNREIAALETRVEELAGALARPRQGPAGPPDWLWLVVGAVVVLALAGVLAVLARRRRDDGDVPFPTPPTTAGAPRTAPAGGAPPGLPELTPRARSGIRPGPGRVPPGKAPESGDGVTASEQTQELTMTLVDMDADTVPAGPVPPAVDSEFLDLGAGPEAGDATAADERERSLTRSITVRLLEVELHLLYEQYADAEEVLLEIIGRESSEQPDMRPWAMAFSLYRQMDDRQRFDDLVVRFRRRYNVVPPVWEEETPPEVDIEERYPHLVDRIAAVWGGPEAGPFLNGLLLDDRGGERLGFEVTVAEDISFLRELVAVREEAVWEDR